MRIALLSDIHGNSIALNAVLEDIQAQGHPDEYWILGDLVAVGPDPIGVLERLFELEEIFYVRGNTDRYVITGEHYSLASEKVKLSEAVEISRSFAWTLGAITSKRWQKWLNGLPTEHRKILPDGTRLLGVHASPNRDGGRGIHPKSSQEDLAALLDGCSADLVCVGHTHSPMNIRVGTRHVVNLGSVSIPFPPDLRASYVMLSADRTEYQVEHRRVDYDREAVISSVKEVGHPAAEFIVGSLRGDIKPGWA